MVSGKNSMAWEPPFTENFPFYARFINSLR